MTLAQVASITVVIDFRKALKTLLLKEPALVGFFPV